MAGRCGATALTIESATVVMTGGDATARLSCEMGEAISLTCRGTFTLETVPTGGAKPPTVVLASGRFAIRNCCSAPSHVVRVGIEGAGRRLIAHRRRATARAIARLDGGKVSATRTVVVLVEGGIRS